MTHHLKISKYRPSILQGTLQLEVTKPRVGLARELAIEKHAVSVLSTLLIILVVGYLYFVASSILNVMARSQAESNMRDIEGSMGTLEQKYLALSQAVTPQEASGLGLAPVASVAYVYRPTDAAMTHVPERNEI